MKHITKRACLALALASTLTVAAEHTAHADPDAAPYSLPWQLRPLTLGHVARLDGAAAAFNDDNGNLDLGFAVALGTGWQLTPNWAPMVRLGFVRNDAPGAALDGSSFGNPLVGVTYTRRMDSTRLGLFGATTIPVGTGGGEGADRATERTNAAASSVRPADDALFAVNYLTAIAGIDFAYVDHGFTAQAEATLQQLVRARGADSREAIDAFRTNSVLGLHLGYFISSHFSMGGDLRYQRWLSVPTSLDMATGMHVPLSEAKMDTLTAALGPRFHLRLGERAWIRPGLAVLRGFDERGFDAPLLTAQTTAVQLDVPVTF
jgi:hypothetical protein